MKYINNNFFVEKVSSERLVKKFDTPLYCYSYERLKQNINNFKLNFSKLNPLICFAIKSNANLNIIKEIKKLGLGADVVSKGELIQALKAGINPKKIVFSGVGKTYSELKYAVDKQILLINSESKSEVIEIEKIAKSKKKIVDIGIRLNPNTDAKTLKKISTGKKGDKFGVNEKTFIELVSYIKKSKYINLRCLSVHIGSQIFENKPYDKMLKVIDRIISKIKFKFDFIDLGGGIGITYKNDNKKFNYTNYKKSIIKFLGKHNSKIIFEPGRSIVGNTGILISKIIYIKENQSKDFIILDAGMNDLMRPALYGAKHRIIPVNKTKKTSSKTYEFVGPICESSDKFSSIKKFQKLKEKDLIIICDVGAYGSSLSSNYNLRSKPAEILIKGSNIIVAKKRQKLIDII
ncbi:MAG: diaminopimelate decarboxylase [Candidatus Pelagibacter sp.]